MNIGGTLCCLIARVRVKVLIMMLPLCKKIVIPVAMCSHVGNEICRNIVSIMDRTKTMAAVQKNVRILL